MARHVESYVVSCIDDDDKNNFILICTSFCSD